MLPVMSVWVPHAPGLWASLAGGGVLLAWWLLALPVRAETGPRSPDAPVVKPVVPVAKTRPARPATPLPRPVGMRLPDPATPLDLRLPEGRAAPDLRALEASPLRVPDAHPLEAYPSEPAYKHWQSPVFQSAPLRPAEGAVLPADGTAGLSLAQAFESGGLDLGSGVCVSMDGESHGAGIRWSSNEGLGLYVQGRAFRQFKRLTDSRRANICPPGENGFLCEDLPRKACQ